MHSAVANSARLLKIVRVHSLLYSVKNDGMCRNGGRMNPQVCCCLNVEKEILQISYPARPNFSIYGLQHLIFLLQNSYNNDLNTDSEKRITKTTNSKIFSSLNVVIKF